MTALVIAAHPDDEALGAGATMRKWSERGDKICVLTITEKSKTREDSVLEKQRRSQYALGVNWAENLGYDAMTLSRQDRYELTKQIEAAIEETEPEIIITHSVLDTHNDHRETARIVQEAARLPIRQTGYDKKFELWYMEILSSTEWGFAGAFAPNVFVEVSEGQLASKVEALKPYDYVLREVPHPRNEETIRAAARLRGSTCGAQYAEAFFCAYREYR